jgi:hypothetical protein
MLVREGACCDKRKMSATGADVRRLKKLIHFICSEIRPDMPDTEVRTAAYSFLAEFELILLNVRPDLYSNIVSNTGQ